MFSRREIGHRVRPLVLRKLQNEPDARPGQVWVGGYHDFLLGRYVWRPGRFVPAKEGCALVQARCEQTRDGWVLHTPRWMLSSMAEQRAASLPSQIRTR
jgi:hypothetical protein